MSTRGSRASRITEDEIKDLIRKLQAVIPEPHKTGTIRGASASKILNETCNYIKSLHREVEDLSERLSALMSSIDTSSAEGELMKSLLVQTMRRSER
ncbi:transcription factor ILI3-like [Macadamia integrifolia]|uniref:transcription factor ILI3-like n=1 Tax=Macadamia integrifolia TaxID=60698 RepID=UPI001C501668|nr:transcription factor ILI3-like [Macadamia integrifolia]